MDDFSEIEAPTVASVMLSAAHIQSGPRIEPLTRVMVYDSAEWERLIDEWVSHCLKQKFPKVLRFSGVNDRGIDIAGFADSKHLLGVWDNF